MIFHEITALLPSERRPFPFKQIASSTRNDRERARRTFKAQKTRRGHIFGGDLRTSDWRGAEQQI
jgi:hypothetical protein